VWLVTSWHDYPAGLAGRTELPLIRWFQKNVQPGQTWLDIGGHYGYTAFALSRRTGSSGRVFTFEPVPATAGCVAQGRALNRLEQLTVLPFGLGTPDTMTLVRLPVTRGMADSTLARSDGTAFADVPVMRFDWLWPRISGTNPQIHGVKIDVQGMELDVIGGMRNTLRATRPLLVVELHHGVDRKEVLSLLNEIGYRTAPVPIEPVPGETVAKLHDDRSYAFLPA
jgi:FkbM family methyltransferase